MKMFSPGQTSVVICCAGMGTRLGIGTTKALIDICGKPLIIRLLEQLNDYDDIRIVVGFQAEKLIQVVNGFRQDIMYVLNHDYETTGVADSLRKALVGARDYLISFDGDTLVDPRDMEGFLACENACLGISPVSSDAPVLADVDGGTVLHLSKSSGGHQWPGIAKIKSSSFKGDSPHVYDVLNKLLPLPGYRMDTRAIDTPEDYDRAVEWFDKFLKENEVYEK